MKQVSVQQVLAQVDRAVPNDCTEAQKLHWLLQAEHIAARAAGQAGPASLAQDTLLTAPVPYDELYVRYLECRLYYELGETSRCNNAISGWNDLLRSWQDECLRGGRVHGAVTALKLC